MFEGQSWGVETRRMKWFTLKRSKTNDVTVLTLQRWQEIISLVIFKWSPGLEPFSFFFFFILQICSLKLISDGHGHVSLLGGVKSVSLAPFCSCLFFVSRCVAVIYGRCRSGIYALKDIARSFWPRVVLQSSVFGRMHEDSCASVQAHGQHWFQPIPTSQSE